MSIPTFDNANTLNVNDVVQLLSDRIRCERRRKNMTQVEFAKACGIPLRTYKRLELGNTDSLVVLIKVVQYLGRAQGLETLFPPQNITPPKHGLEAALKSIRSKLDARVVKGEAILDLTNNSDWLANDSRTNK